MLIRRLKDASFKVLTDVQNPLLGIKGAARIYAAQKGASKKEVEKFEEGVSHLATLFANGNEHALGARAVSGLGHRAMTFLNAEVQSGIKFLLESTELEEKVRWADLVISCEGSIDYQTLEGKAIFGLHQICTTSGTPLGIVCGVSSLEFDRSPIHQVMSKARNIQDAIDNAAFYLKELAQELLSEFEV